MGLNTGDDLQFLRLPIKHHCFSRGISSHDPLSIVGNGDPSKIGGAHCLRISPPHIHLVAPQGPAPPPPAQPTMFAIREPMPALPTCDISPPPTPRFFA